MGNIIGNSETKEYTCKNCCKVYQIHNSMVDESDPTFGYCTRCSIQIVARGKPTVDKIGEDKISHINTTILSNEDLC
jgi:DNA-directed RNA polymerase subunit RPC12/RpoP